MKVTLSLSASLTHFLPLSDDWLQSGGSDGQGCLLILSYISYIFYLF